MDSTYTPVGRMVRMKVAQATTFRLAKASARTSFFAALLALSGAPLAFAQSSSLPPFESHAPPGLQGMADKMESEITAILQEARDWTGLPVDPRPFRLEWVSGRKELEGALGYKAPSWFAAVAELKKRRLVIATEVAGSQELTLTVTKWLSTCLFPTKRKSKQPLSCCRRTTCSRLQTATL